jgi:hypothetical protein
MPDTGAPWNIPYIAPTDNPRVYPAADEAQALAIAAGLTAAGNLKAVKTVVKTDTQANTLAGGASTAVTGLEITHAVEKSTNKVVLLGLVTGSRSSGAADHAIGAFLTAAGSALNIGDAAGSRTRIGAANYAGNADYGNSMTLLAVHSPGVTSNVTYGASVVNMAATSLTVYVNRTSNDGDTSTRARSASVLILMEVQ